MVDSVSWLHKYWVIVKMLISANFILIQNVSGVFAWLTCVEKDACCVSLYRGFKDGLFLVQMNSIF